MFCNSQLCGCRLHSVSIRPLCGSKVCWSADKLDFDAAAKVLPLLLQVYSVSVSPYFGSAAPKPTDKLNGDVAISFSCSPANTHQLIELALAEVQALQVRCPQAARATCVVATRIRAKGALKWLDADEPSGRQPFAPSQSQGEAGCTDIACIRQGRRLL